MTYAHDAHCNTDHEAGPEPCPLALPDTIATPAQARFVGEAGVAFRREQLGEFVNSGVDLVNHPPHYSAHPSGIEVIKITRDLTFDVGNAVKYVMRAPHKGNERQDVEKAQWYLNDAAGHADSIMFAKDVVAVRKLLHLVAEHETDPNRIDFFHAVADRDLTMAAICVDRMVSALIDP